MVGQDSLHYRMVNWILRVLLLMAALSCLLPILNTVAISFSSKRYVNEVAFWPKGFSLAAYKKILEDTQFFRSFWVSVKKVAVGTSLNMILTLLMAYPLSKSDRVFPARGHYMRVIITCMLFSGGTIPWYIVIKSLGLLDTFWALVLPGAVNIGNTIIMMNFFKGLPPALAESAAIDGASPLKTLVHIYVPLSAPSIATLSLFCIVGHWNDSHQRPEEDPAANLHPVARCGYQHEDQQHDRRGDQGVFRDLQPELQCGKDCRRDGPGHGDLSHPAKVLCHRSCHGRGEGMKIPSRWAGKTPPAG